MEDLPLPNLINLSLSAFVFLLGIVKRAWLDSIILPVFVVLAFSMAADYSAAYMAYGLRLGNNLIVSHIYGFLEAVLLGWFFYQFLVRWPKTTLLVSAGLALFFLVNSLFMQTVQVYPDNAYVLGSIIFIILSLVGFYQFFVDEETYSLTSEPTFWVLCGVILYFSGSLFSFIMSSEILSPDTDSSEGLWLVHNGMLAIKNLSFGLAFILRVRR